MFWKIRVGWKFKIGIGRSDVQMSKTAALKKTVLIGLTWGAWEPEASSCVKRLDDGLSKLASLGRQLCDDVPGSTFQGTARAPMDNWSFWDSSPSDSSITLDTLTSDGIPCSSTSCLTTNTACCTWMQAYAIAQEKLLCSSPKCESIPGPKFQSESSSLCLGR